MWIRATFFCCVMLIGEQSSAEQSRRPNFAIVMVDDMGYGDAGC